MKRVQILGSSCLDGRKLMENTEAAIKNLGFSCQIEKITDASGILSFGLTMTPALAIDGQIKIAGRVASIAEVQKILVL